MATTPITEITTATLHAYVRDMKNADGALSLKDAEALAALEAEIARRSTLCPECEGTGWQEHCDLSTGPYFLRCHCPAGHETLLRDETARRMLQAERRMRLCEDCAEEGKRVPATAGNVFEGTPSPTAVYLCEACRDYHGEKYDEARYS